MNRVRALAVLLVLAFLVIGGAYWQSARSVNEVRAQQRMLATQEQAQCKFDADLGGAPVAVNPATDKPSLLGVTIVSDARVAWRGLHCSGVLPAAEPSFIRWARYYHLPD